MIALIQNKNISSTNYVIRKLYILFLECILNESRLDINLQQHQTVFGKVFQEVDNLTQADMVHGLISHPVAVGVWGRADV